MCRRLAAVLVELKFNVSEVYSTRLCTLLGRHAPIARSRMQFARDEKCMQLTLQERCQRSMVSRRLAVHSKKLKVQFLGRKMNSTLSRTPPLHLPVRRYLFPAALGHLFSRLPHSRDLELH